MPREQPTVIVRDPGGVVVSPALADAVADLVRVGFGGIALGLGVVLRTLGEDAASGRRPARPALPVSEVADLVVGAAWGAATVSGKLVTTGSRVAGPVLRLALRPPLVPRHLQPGHGVDLVIQRWQRDRPGTVRSLGRWSATVVPGTVDAVLSQLDMEQLVVALIESVDLDAVVTTALAQVDLDAVVTTALARLDLAAVVSAVLDQIDLTQLVLDRVDLERVVAAALEPLDLTAIVVDKVDLGTVVGAALDRVDLTQVVLQQVDLIGVAEYVVEGIDLPEIIRSSTGSVASEAVRGLRMQGVDADAAVTRVVDQVLRRRRRHHVTSADPTHASDAPSDNGSTR